GDYIGRPRFGEYPRAADSLTTDVRAVDPHVRASLRSASSSGVVVTPTCHRSLGLRHPHTDGDTLIQHGPGDRGEAERRAIGHAASVRVGTPARLRLARWRRSQLRC